MKIKIKVTKEILRESMNCDSKSVEVGTSCGIACAVRELFPFAVVQELATSLLGITPNGADMVGRPTFDVIANSINMKGFLRTFDMSTPAERLKMKECEFEIDVPEAVIETIGLSEVHRILKDSKTLELA